MCKTGWNTQTGLSLPCPYAADTATQLWIAALYMGSLTFTAAPLLVHRKITMPRALGVCPGTSPPDCPAYRPTPCSSLRHRQKHGGWIGVESAICRGTPVRVFLPIHEAASHHKGVEPPAADRRAPSDVN